MGKYKFFEVTEDSNMVVEKSTQENLVEESFGNLEEELYAKIDPRKFSDDLEKMSIAVDLYSLLRNGCSKEELITIRNRAMDEMGISFSAVRLLDELKGICDPNLYNSGDNFNRELAQKAIYLTTRINLNTNDIRELERIKEEAAPLYDEIRRRENEAELKRIQESIRDEERRKKEIEEKAEAEKKQKELEAIQAKEDKEVKIFGFAIVGLIILLAICEAFL